MTLSHHLETLAHGTYEHAVSIGMPTHRAGQEIMQDPIRLGNLLDRAEERLVARGLRRDDARNIILRPARELVTDKEYWRHQQDGLALFLAPGVFHQVKAPAPLPEVVQVGRRFHILALLRALGPEEPFLLLSLSQQRVALHAGGRDGLTPQDTRGYPQSVQEIYDESDYSQTINANPTSRKRRARTQRFQPDTSNVAQAHNVGNSAEQTRYAELIEFLRRVAAAAEADERVTARGLPVVLAALPDLQGEFRKIADLDALLPGGVEANPEGLDEAELHRRALAAVAPHFAERRRGAVDRTIAALGDPNDPRGSTHPGDIVRAAHWARVDTLLLTDGARLPGHYDEAADRVEVTPATAEAEDLLNFAALETLRHGGQVRVVPPGTVPGDAPAAALMRWAE